MANARSHFDMISGYLQRAHEAEAGLLYGKPCLTLQGRAFVAYLPDAMAFHLHGRAMLQAETLPGACGWDPRHDDAVAPGWVLLPVAQMLRWNRLALEALRCEREAIEGRVYYSPTAAPAPLPKAALPAGDEPAPSTAQSLAQRVSTAIASGFATLTLSEVEHVERADPLQDLDRAE